MMPCQKIRNASVRIDIRRLLISLLWWGMWIGSYFEFARREHFSIRDISYAGWAVVAIVLLLPIPLCGLWRSLREREWEGEVVRKRVGIYYTSMRTGYVERVDAEYVYVKKPNGKLYTMVFREKDILSAGYFHVGDRVRHYRNAPYCEKIDRREDEHENVCVFCGKLFTWERDTCLSCGKPMASYPTQEETSGQQ